jgi:AcrR family transcriptional regulator
MAITVDKEKKREMIALACSELLMSRGISKLTISEIAKTAGIGKGTIYEYFSNKDEIVFEIMTILIGEFEEKLLDLISKEKSTKNRLFYFFYLIFDEVKYTRELNIYREFLSIALTNSSSEMIAFSLECHNRFMTILEGILDEGIRNNEIQAISSEIIPGLSSLAKGFIVDTKVTGVDAKILIDNFVNALFALIQKEPS